LTPESGAVHNLIYRRIGEIHAAFSQHMARGFITGTDVLEERDSRVAVFYTFIDDGTPPISTTK
jgi:hypothetical protein